MEYSGKEKEIFRRIGEFFLELSNNDYELAKNTIKDLGITKINVLSETIVISLSRPGLLIGKRGVQINSLTNYLKGYGIYGINRIEMIEDDLFHFLIPHN